jgi:hypothetical protein
LCRNCSLKHVIEWKIEGRTAVTWRWRRRHKQLLDDLKEKRGYCNLKERALDRTLWRTRFGRVWGPVVRQTRKWWSFTSDLRYGLVNIGQTWLEGSIWQLEHRGKPRQMLILRFIGFILDLSIDEQLSTLKISVPLS